VAIGLHKVNSGVIRASGLKTGSFQHATALASGFLTQDVASVSAFTDRRAGIRSEVVGRLRGALEIAQPARVVNISSIGALIETSMPAAIGSSRPLRLTVEGQSVRVETLVRSVTQISEEPQALYAIGVEFVSPSESLTALVGSLIAEAQID
jgi:hypothetical protein